jgi:hypothetical protein
VPAPSDVAFSRFGQNETARRAPPQPVVARDRRQSAAAFRLLESPRPESTPHVKRRCACSSRDHRRREICGRECRRGGGIRGRLSRDPRHLEAPRRVEGLQGARRSPGQRPRASSSRTSSAKGRSSPSSRRRAPRSARRATSGCSRRRRGRRSPTWCSSGSRGARSRQVLSTRSKSEGMPPRTLLETMTLLAPAAEALALAHARGIAHRDVKPANIFLLGDPRARIVPRQAARLRHREGRAGRAEDPPVRSPARAGR